MATVVLFAYYPEARYVMAVAFGNHFGEFFFMKEQDESERIIELTFGLTVCLFSFAQNILMHFLDSKFSDWIDCAAPDAPRIASPGRSTDNCHTSLESFASFSLLVLDAIV